MSSGNDDVIGTFSLTLFQIMRKIFKGITDYLTIFWEELFVGKFFPVIHHSDLKIQELPHHSYFSGYMAAATDKQMRAGVKPFRADNGEIHILPDTFSHDTLPEIFTYPRNKAEHRIRITAG